MKRKKVEILAPAGSFESMKAAIVAGADAVYIGGSRFGARAFAENPDEDRLLEAIDYAHIHGRRLYLTVNTLMKNEEMKELYAYLVPYYKHGLDAAIVQDLGVFAYLRRHFPDLPIHASTQMTITGVYGARLLKELGAERVVTARELSLEEIKRIHREVDIEIESFVHGALCYSYSGQCLFSSLIGGRSGNRGRCAQTCRLPFDVKRDGRILNKKDEKYCLSLKDLCTLDFIPDMVDAGIYSMKIEGRMKSPRYTAGVTAVYRKYVDLYLAQGRTKYRVEEEDRKLLQELFDRGGQTDGYYKRHNGPDMAVWKEKPSFREGNQSLFEYLDKSFVEKQMQEPVKGTALLEEGSPAVLNLEACGCKVKVSGGIVLAAKNQPMTAEKVRKQLEKTGNTPFYFEHLETEIRGNGFLPVQALNDLRRRGLEALYKKIMEQFFRQTDQPAGESAENFVFHSEKQSDKNRNFPVSVSLERPDTFLAAVESPEVTRIYLDSAEFEPDQWLGYTEVCHKSQKECMLTMPHIFRSEAELFFNSHLEELKKAGFDGFLLRSLEESEYLKEKKVKGARIFDYGLYGMNDYAEEMLLSLGADELTWPVELNSRELGKLKIPGELLIYGRLPMMVTAQCLHQGTEGCDKKAGVLMLKDRMGKEFPVKNHCRFCYNTIYNAAPVSLAGMEAQIGNLKPLSVRLQFTTETEAQVRSVIRSFGQAEPFQGEFTRGHFKRGVE